jgi:hypothetical protein
MDRARHALQNKIKIKGVGRFWKKILLFPFKVLCKLLLFSSEECFFFYVTLRYTDFSTVILRLLKSLMA